MFGDPVVLWVRGLSCFFAFELEARLVFVHFDTTTRCEVTGWCCDQPRHFSFVPLPGCNSVLLAAWFFARKAFKACEDGTLETSNFKTSMKEVRSCQSLP